MKALAVLLLTLLPQDAPVDTDKLERLRKMNPEERSRLLERLEQYKQLSTEEKDRLKENLGRFRQLPPEAKEAVKGRLAGLSEEKRKLYRDLANGFFRTLVRRNPKEMRGFPRGLCLQWIRRERKGEMERILGLSAEERSPAFLDLYRQFRSDVEARTLRHAEKQRCFDMERAKNLRTAGEDFWLRWRELVEPCPHAPKTQQRFKAGHP